MILTDATTEALATTSIGKRSNKQNSNIRSDNSTKNKIKDKKSVECYICHKLGHYARDYRKRKNIKEHKRDNNSISKTSNEQKNSSDEHGAFLITKIEDSIMNADTSNTWLLDSDASKHMSF